ncbi:MAG: DUF4125 family protein [Peptococcaceae bacterium]|nr:DUF4125 family protein [Peptococcaceae bacterium]
MTQDLIAQIVAQEWAMFNDVQNNGGRADCQNNPKEFEIMRSSQLKTWSEDVLKSYLNDLVTAAYMGRNMLTEKYAYMMETTHPIEFQEIKQFLPEVPPQIRAKIDEIVDINLDWQQEADEKYPNLRAKGRPLSSKEDSPYVTSFETYLRGELKTYSADTVMKLHAHTLACLEKKYNMAIANLQNMIGQLGYASLEEANEKMAGR